MYQVLVRVVARYAPVITLPVAIVLGFIGYSIESRFSSMKTPYLESSINDERDKRLLDEIDRNQRDSSSSTLPPPSKNIFDKNDPKKLL